MECLKPLFFVGTLSAMLSPPSEPSNQRLDLHELLFGGVSNKNSSQSQPLSRTTRQVNLVSILFSPFFISLLKHKVESKLPLASHTYDLNYYKAIHYIDRNNTCSNSNLKYLYLYSSYFISNGC